MPVMQSSRRVLWAPEGYSIRPIYATPGGPNSLTRDLPPYPLLWVNEVQPVNVNGPRDNMGEAEPWIELYNSGPTNISLQGYYLSDDFNNLTKWAFPAGSSINPGEFKLIWADNEPGETTPTQLHATITLGAPTGAVVLARSLGGSEVQILDYLKYAGQSAGRSYGHYPDGQLFRDQAFFTPTPGATNTARDVSVFINEFMAANTSTPPLDPVDGDYEDWIELYNPGADAVDLSGYFLTDNLTNSTQFRIPDGTIIPANGYLVILADNEPNQTAVDPAHYIHANFGLRAQGEDIGLYAPNGVTLIDGINDFPPQTNNVSMGRFPDATGGFQYMTNATAGRVNIPNASGVNHQPVMLPIGNKFMVLGETLSFTLPASDPDPGQTLGYTGTGFPSGATLGLLSGLFQWTPTPAQAPSTTSVNVTATDNGTPPMSASRSFTIYVSLPPQITINRETGGITMSFATIAGRQYQVLFKNALTDALWSQLGGPRTATGSTMEIPDAIGAHTQRFYKIEVVGQ